MRTYLLVLFVTCCTLGSQLVLKSGVGPLVAVLRSEGTLSFLLAAATSPRVLTALTFQGIGYGVWMLVIAQERLSVAFAISGAFFYLAMAACSWFFFGERLTLLQWVGLGLISIGVVLVSQAGGPA